MVGDSTPDDDGFAGAFDSYAPLVLRFGRRRLRGLLAETEDPPAAPTEQTFAVPARNQASEV